MPVTLEDFGGASAFSPDGLLIATSTGTADITVIDRVGAIVTTIVAIPGGEFGTFPGWQRLPA